MLLVENVKLERRGLRKMNLNKYKVEEFFRETIMHNIGYKVLSALLAVMTWIVIINIADPMTTKTFSGLEVEIRNQNAITSINQVFEVVEGDTIDFSVRGKSSVVRNLKLSDFTAYADLSQLSPVYAADIKVLCNKSDSIDIDIDTNNKMLLVKLENIKKKNVQVAVETVGQVADGYYVGDYEVKPNMITVSGGASRIAKLDTIKIQVNVDGAKNSFTTRMEPVAYDKDGEVIDSKYLSFTNNDVVVKKVSIEVSIYNTKTIPILLDIAGEPAEGYIYNNSYEYTPQTITIGGQGKRLAKIDSLTIPIDITGVSESYEENVFLADYLPEGIKLVSNEQDVSVRVSLEKIVDKTIVLTVKDIELINVDSDYAAIFADANATVSMQLSGTEEELAKYDASSVGAYIDLKNKGTGVYFVQPECKNVSDDLYVTRPGTIKIEVTDRSEQTSAPGESVIEPVVTATPGIDDSIHEEESTDNAGE